MPQPEPKHVKVLVCEDNSAHQNLLLIALVKGRARVDVTVVSTGRQMLDAVRESRFDCVVLDYHLGADSAPKLIDAASDALGGCPVLVISNSDDQRVVIDAMRHGVVDFIPKAEAVRGNMLWRRVAWNVTQARKNRLDRRRAERRERCLARESETDFLTGLYNRRYVDRWLEQGRWAGDRRKHQCCLMLDIDHFKSVNDRYGHGAGDAVLCKVSAILREHTGPSGIAVRWGGEEFLTIHPLTDRADCVLHAERLKNKIAQATVHYKSHQIRVTASVGVVHVRSDRLSAATIERADQALYLAKQWGRDRVCTGQTVLVDKTLDELVADASTERKRWTLLRRIEPTLGATQWEHVTQHGVRVSETACSVAHALGMTLDQIEHVRQASLLHDIGKCLIPEEVLAKPCPLAFEEMQLIAEHAETSAWIAQKLGADPRVVLMIRHHHKRFDRARAQGMLDSQFPLGARVICVADALVTMTTDRPYRSRLSFSDAVSELQRERGSQFDPAVVDVAWFARTGTILEAA